MPAEKKYDLLIKNVRVVRPNRISVQKADVAIEGGKFARVGRDIPAEQARKVVDGKGLLAFPGLVDPHMHTGIYSPLAEDAVSESRAAAQGGVTSSLNYFRTGHYYLNKGGPYARVLPRGARDLRRPLPRGLRLPPDADGPPSHIAEMPTSGRQARRHVLQDLHVLRRLRAPRRVDNQHEFLMIEPGREVRHRPLRVRHARRPRGAIEQFKEARDLISSASTARPPRS
jgi:hypothetical protein